MKEVEYLEAKNKLLEALKQLVEVLENVGENSLSGEQRKIFFEKFDLIDHKLLGKFDQASYNKFEEEEKSDLN